MVNIGPPTKLELLDGARDLSFDAPEAFVEARDGFRIQRARGLGTWRGVDITIPRESGDAIRMRGFGGYEIRVFETGASGRALLADGAVRYPRPGGTSYWTATGDGVEEWLHLGGGASAGGRAAATWRVEGARLAQAGNTVHVVDTAGMVRLIVTASKAYTSGGRALPVQLRAERDIISLFVDAGEDIVLVDPGWTAVTPMPTGRYQHTATVLQSGRLLVTGGKDDADHPVSSALLYDPTTNSWADAGQMNEPRFAHTATALPDGRVLILGGFGGPPPNYYDLATAELYEPGGNMWVSAAPISGVVKGIWGHTATLLLNGKVLVAGGWSGGALLSGAELYDPATNTWSATAGMSQARMLHATVLLGGGDVLVAGGSDIKDLGMTGVERYDAAKGTFSTVGSMAFPRFNHSAVLLPSGKVLVAGGSSKGVFPPDALSSAERFDPSTNSWSAAQAMKNIRTHLRAERQLGGGSLVAGGHAFPAGPMASAELFSPEIGQWLTAASMGRDRYLHTLTVLPTATIIAVGGLDKIGALSSAEIYTPEIANCVTIAHGASGNAADAGLRADQPNANAGSASFMNVGYLKQNNLPGAWRSLVRFDLTPIPGGVKIVFAKLRLYSLGTNASLLLDVHRANAPWAETTVTWNNFANAFEPVGAAQFSLNPQFVGTVSVDVTDLVTQWVAGGVQNYGVLIKDNKEANQNDELVHFATSEAGNPTSIPALDVCWVQP